MKIKPMSNLWIFVFGLGLTLIAGPVQSLPRPTSSEPGQFVSPKLGFRISAGNTAWLHEVPPKSIPSIATIYKAPQTQNGVQAAFTVRVDRLDKSLSLAQYVRRFMQDYHRFGFDVLQSQRVNIEGQDGFLIDLINRDAEKQLRQIVLVKDKTAVILTCRDQQESFNHSLRACNEIARQFRWL